MASEPRVVQEEAQALRVAQSKGPEPVVYQDLLEKEKQKQVAEPSGQKT
jgi:hypothetical protein